MNTDSINVITKNYSNTLIHIIGCGAVGSYFFQTLFRAGYPLNLITLWDFDTVEEANISSQVYTQSDVGKPKTESLIRMVHKTLLPEKELEILLKGGVSMITTLPRIKEKYTTEKLEGIVIIAVDSLQSRIDILEHCKESFKIEHVYTIGFPNIYTLSDLAISFNSIAGENYEAMQKLIDLYKEKLNTEKEDREEAFKKLALIKACRMPNVGVLSQLATAELFLTFLENVINKNYNLTPKEFFKTITPFS